jgi:hypothetical protein
MPRAFDGTQVPEFLDPLPCGGRPRWDYGSAAGYRCENCMAMAGSIGMPTECHDMLQDEIERNQVIKTMGFKDEEN